MGGQQMHPNVTLHGQVQQPSHGNMQLNNVGGLGGPGGNQMLPPQQPATSHMGGSPSHSQLMNHLGNASNGHQAHLLHGPGGIGGPHGNHMGGPPHGMLSGPHMGMGGGPAGGGPMSGGLGNANLNGPPHPPGSHGPHGPHSLPPHSHHSPLGGPQNMFGGGPPGNSVSPMGGPMAGSSLGGPGLTGPGGNKPPMTMGAGKMYPPGQPMVFNPQNPNAPPIYPCGVCHKEVNDNDEAVFCESGCNFFFHR